MKMQESFQVDCGLQQVWDFVGDPHKIASCVPSVQSIEVIDDRRYKAVVKQKIGFISATFEIQTEVLVKEPPSKIVFSNRGRTILGAGGTTRSTDTIMLQSASDGVTQITVVSDLALGGQLAILGAKLIEVKFKEIFAEATANLKAKLKQGVPEIPEKPRVDLQSRGRLSILFRGSLRGLHWPLARLRRLWRGLRE